MTTSKQSGLAHAFKTWTTAFLAGCVIVAVHRGRVYAGGYEIRKNLRLDLVYLYAWGHRRVDGVHYRQRINAVGLSMSCMFYSFPEKSSR
ncbi:MAG TPA: hypothetical protein VJJ98_08030 [Sedimentisphaerales bacterium]|nr:hypothetical protein [Sedimentisphaerales bacterium]